MTDDAFRTRAEAISLASRTLATFVESDVRARALLGSPALPARGDVEASFSSAWADGGIAALAIEKRRRVLQIAGSDLAGEIPLEQTCTRLADVADACIRAALSGLDVSDGLSIIAMGKLGARELNYFSDIDLVFVARGDLHAATKTAERFLSTLGGHSSAGRAYIIDTNLRPEGRNGPLVRTRDGFLEYYRRWAQHWEFQALIKARPVAGDINVGRELVDETRALVFPSPVPSERITGIRAIKQRVEDHAARTHGKRTTRGDDVKLGPGGIRDIEFSVQLLQLVHGGTDETVRAAATLDALRALVEGGYIADDDAAGLSVAYRWLRTVEHRLQLWQERRVRELPRDDQGRARLARSLRYRDSPEASAVQRFDADYRSVLTDVRFRFDKLFYRPMIETLAEPGGRRLDAQAIRERLRVLGFRDVERAARTLETLVEGTSRRARLLRVLAAPMLRYLSAAPLPDEGLLAFLRLAESLDTRLDSLGALRDNPPGIQLLARALGSGRVVGELLMHVPEDLRMIADPARPFGDKDPARLLREARSSLGWRQPDQRLDGLRRFKRREQLRIVLADLDAEFDVTEVGRSLADLADACLQAEAEGADLPFAVIGLGKLGGRELSYASDLDVAFVHAGDPARAEKLAEDLIHALGEVTPEGQAFRVDPGLRPEGRAGALARSLDSFLEYYDRWARPWEALVLTKARPVAGDLSLGAEFVTATRRVAYPPRLDPGALREIRHLKARMARERIPRGVDPRRHLKLGPGGLSDIEFAVGILQLEHAHKYPELRVTGCIEGVRAARGCGLLSSDAAARLVEAYEFLARVRNRLFLMTGRPVDALPTKPETVEALGTAVGFVDQPRQELEEHFLRLTRRARHAVEPLLLG